MGTKSGSQPREILLGVKQVEERPRELKFEKVKLLLAEGVVVGNEGFRAAVVMGLLRMEEEV